MAPLKRQQTSALARWYNKLAEFNVENLFVKKKGPGPPRTIFMNQSLPQDYYDPKGRVKKDHVYATNQVVTSKYTVITFLPRNLLEQFRRIANVFFAAIAILQFFPQFNTISPGLVILPLLVVLLITGGKDGYEDIKRHQSDRRINLSHIRVLAGGEWSNPNAMAGKGRTLTRSILPFLPRGIKRSKVAQKEGQPSPDVGLVEQGVPPDARAAPPPQHQESDIEFDHEHDAQFANPRRLSQRRQSTHRQSSILSGSHHRDISKPHWKRTAWEDVRVGDVVKLFNEESFPADILICSTSEDENVCFIETKNLDGETNLKSRNAVQALSHLRDAAAFNDAQFGIELDQPDPNMYKLNGTVVTDKGRYGLDLQTVLLRGTVLKNTKWVIGIVMFTGNDTKIVLNSGGTPSKRSKVERQMNPQVFVNLLILAVMAVTCAIVDSILEHRDYPKQAPWLLFANQSDDNPSINGLITWAFALITFQNIVPISLYISIEAVRTCQAAFIYFDKEIWYEKTNQPTLARSWNLSDDLGQIEYIFSDKTGTLTQNVMLFRHCSVGGKVYLGEEPKEQSADVTTSPVGEKKDSNAVNARFSAATTAATSTAVASDGEQQRPIEVIDTRSSDTIPVPDPSATSRAQASSSASVEAVDPPHRFHSLDLDADLQEAVHADMGSENAFQARTLNGFFTVLALCHTVLAAHVPDQPGKLEYKAQSPDEAALVQAAADVGFVFLGRDKEIVSMRTPFSPNGEAERYELLNVLDFTSARKRMSVLLRKLDEEGVEDGEGRIFLLTKGADNVIFERLKPGVNEELKKVTEQHLDKFASEGLRTLTLAYKVVPNDVYDEWITRYDQASASLRDREEQVAVVSDEIEHELRLLGATAIEDRLQDGVPETIADLKLAGIKVWVATGDKLETAIAIGYSTNLIAQESNLIVVRSTETHDNANLSTYHQLYTAVEEFFPEGNIIEEEGLADDEKAFSSAERGSNGRDSPHRLHRVNTGVSSIVGRNNGDRPGGFVLVIEGTALQHALAEDHSKRLLLRLSILCEAVICCRVSPLQKALIVHLIKDGIGAMTLAIGDGANDVSMIQAADVGVGISGEEGLQAVNSSDYAIGQFRFLKRLLLVHGHWAYARNGNMIVNFFYKNIICIGILWWFVIYCAWSSAYFFEYTYLLFWNVFWSLCPVIAIGLFDRIIDDDILMEIPELYRYGREGHWFSHKTFAIYMIDAVYQSAVIFFVINYGYFSPTARTDGFDVAQYEYATTAVITAAMVANAYNGLNTTAWTGWVFFAILVGPILIWVYSAIYAVISPGWFATPIYGNYHYLFRSALFWLSIPIGFCFALLPRYISKAYRFTFMPTDIDRMRWVRKMDPSRRTRAELLDTPPTEKRRKSRVMEALNASNVTVSDPRRGSRTDMATGMNMIHRGFDFSMEEGGVAIQRMQTNLSERRRSVRMSQVDIPSGEGKASKNGHKRGHSRHLFSLPRSLRKKKPPPTD